MRVVRDIAVAGPIICTGARLPTTASTVMSFASMMVIVVVTVVVVVAAITG